MKKRFYFFIFLNFIVIAVWIGYLFTIQILDPYNFAGETTSRYKPFKEILVPVRGSILDRNHKTLTASINYYQLDIDRTVLDSQAKRRNVSEREAYETVSNILSNNSSLAKNFILNRLERSSSPYIYITDRIMESERINIIRELAQENLRGVSFKYSHSTRVYTAGQLAARLIGSVARREDNTSLDNPGNAYTVDRGITGIEATFNNLLSGNMGWQEVMRDARNNNIYLPGLEQRPAENGHDIVLTINSDFQEIVELHLQTSLELYKASNAISIVMNPKTGEILAMAGISKSDKVKNINLVRTLPNMAVSFMFEPGSTIKPFTAVAALENKLFRTDEIIDCRTYRIFNRVIRDVHPKKDLSFRDIIIHSSNVGTSKVAEKIGEEKLYNTLVSFGFGNRLNSDFYGESPGLLRRVRDWQGYSLHSISFGQEISVSPLQLATSYSALANNGKMMQPQIIREVKDQNGRTIRGFNPNLIRRVSQKTVLDTLKVIMRDVVEHGTGSATRMSQFYIAGKTGTAEKALIDRAGYSRELYVSNFVGFFPVEDPQLVVVVIIDEPAYQYRYASISAVETFKKIVESIVALPDCTIISDVKETSHDFVKMPDITGMDINRAERVLNNRNIKFIMQVFHEKGVVANQYPKPGVHFDRNNQVIVIIDRYDESYEVGDFDTVMPELRGLTVRKALREAKKRSVKLVVRGTGVIYEQSVNPGSRLEFGERCIVKAR